MGWVEHTVWPIWIQESRGARGEDSAQITKPSSRDLRWSISDVAIQLRCRTMTAHVDLKLEGPMNHLRLAWQAGETLLADVPFEEAPEETRYNILLSLQELLTNVFRHAYHGDEQLPVEIRMRSSDESFEFEIWDRGPQFDPTRPGPIADGESGVELRVGGYGLIIVQVVMDDFDYRYERGWNVIRACKRVRSPVPENAVEPQKA